MDTLAPSLSETERTLAPGECMELTLSPANGKNVVWTSNRESVATILPGDSENSVQILAKSVGTARITASCRGKTYRCNITVTDQSVTMTPLEMEVPRNVSFPVTLQGIDAPVSWSSSDSSIAAVDETGIVTAVSEGTAFIYAQAEGRLFRCAVTVTAAPAVLTGDVNLDNSISLADLVKLNQYLCKTVDLDAAAQINAKCEYLTDLENITFADSMVLREYLLGMMPHLPVQILS